MGKNGILAFVFVAISCKSATVYVCDSGRAMKYHYDANCRGLKSCAHHVIKVSLDEAKAGNKKLCEWERER